MSEFGFNNIDIAILFIVAFSGVTALFRGFVKEILSISGWVVALLLTSRLLFIVKPAFRDIIKVEVMADLIASTVVFMSITIVWAILTGIMSTQVKNSCLSGLDKIYGFAFGLIRACVLITVAYVFVSFFLPKENMPKVITEAKSFVYVEKAGDIVLKMAPEQVVLIKEKLVSQIEQKDVAGDEKDNKNFKKGLDNKLIGNIADEKLEGRKPKETIPYTVKMENISPKMFEKKSFEEEAFMEDSFDDRESKEIYYSEPEIKSENENYLPFLENAKNIFFKLALDEVKKLQSNKAANENDKEQENKDDVEQIFFKLLKHF